VEKNRRKQEAQGIHLRGGNFRQGNAKTSKKKSDDRRDKAEEPLISPGPEDEKSVAGPRSVEGSAQCSASEVAGRKIKTQEIHHGP